jgi:type I restriction enzyme S subunit
MAGRLPPFPDYRDSGLPWLGRIPAHWEVRRNGRLFAQRNETGHPDLPILEVSLRTGVRIRDLGNSKRKQVMEDRAKYKRAAAGDIAYNMMRMWQGAVGTAPTDGLVSPAYVVAAPFSGTETRYYSYLFRTAAYMREVDTFSRGIVSDRNRLYWDEFKQMPSVFPPPAEQKAIADFLDAHGRLTRRFIRNKRRLIGLLDEQKRVIVNAAVMRGLVSTVGTKPTGVEWSPEIPAHWSIRKIKQVATFNPSRSEVNGQFDPSDDVVFLPMERVSEHGKIDCSERGKIRDLSNGYTYFRRGDIVLAKITPCFENGKGAYLNQLETDIGFGTTEFIVLRARQEIDPAFLFEVTRLHAFRQLGAIAMTGAAGQQRIPSSFVKEFQFGLPPRDEQQKILAYIESEPRSIDEAIERATREIDLIREYRERLIADVVTGKSDVRRVRLATAVDETEVEEIDDTDDTDEREEPGDDLDIEIDAAEADD